MKSLAICAAMVLCLGLTACAGTSGSNGMARRTNLDNDIDIGKVITVNQWALRRGATVMWINYPTRSERLVAHNDG